MDERKERVGPSPLPRTLRIVRVLAQDTEEEIRKGLDHRALVNLRRVPGAADAPAGEDESRERGRLLMQARTVARIARAGLAALAEGAPRQQRFGAAVRRPVHEVRQQGS